MSRDYDLPELGRSIADNGYFLSEPLVVIAAEKEGKYTVVEGNRRLAALLLLSNPDSADPAHRDEWGRLSRTCRHDVSLPVPIVVYDERENIVPLLGFRHISGVLRWEPLAKARFVAYLVRDRKRSYADVAREIGSTLPTVKSHYVAYMIVEQAEQAFSIDTSAARERFGVFRRSLSTMGIREYIGVDLDKSAKSLERPVPKVRAQKLVEVVSWLFGDKADSPVLKDSRDLSKLGTVLLNKASTDFLRTNRDLQLAYRMSGGEEQDVLDNLQHASYFLDEVLRSAHRHKKSRKAEELVRRCSQTVREIAKSFPSMSSEG